MRHAIRKLIVGRGHRADEERYSTIERRWANVVAVWNNTYEEDAGLEKVVRLILAASQFLFPGMYIKHLFWKRGSLVQDFAIEVFVVFKTCFPIIVMAIGWEREPVAYALVIWFMAETIAYIPTLIFASDTFPSPRSYRRSKLLIFLNYLEVVFSFALIHLAGQYMNHPFADWKDAVYASFVITSTIGFGDFYPITGMGKLVVALQSLFYLSYIALFISFFAMGGGKGYFGDLGRKG
ncbi:MAG: two pore domain potassium channel family protein [Flavobacteriales bacterium]|nr:two pore domain potassium channel family protein [Flavobacteriales bacterium]